MLPMFQAMQVDFRCWPPQLLQINQSQLLVGFVVTNILWGFDSFFSSSLTLSELSWVLDDRTSLSALKRVSLLLCSSSKLTWKGSGTTCVCCSFESSVILVCTCMYYVLYIFIALLDLYRFGTCLQKKMSCHT